MGKPSARATTTRVVSGMINKSWDVSRSVSQCGIRRTRFFASREVGVRRSVGVAGARKRKQRPVKEEGRRRVYERLLIFATHVSPFYRAFFPPARPPARTQRTGILSAQTRAHITRGPRALLQLLLSTLAMARLYATPEIGFMCTNGKMNRRGPASDASPAISISSSQAHFSFPDAPAAARFYCWRYLCDSHPSRHCVRP